jgi:hypothetical protein
VEVRARHDLRLEGLMMLREASLDLRDADRLRAAAPCCDERHDEQQRQLRLTPGA